MRITITEIRSIVRSVLLEQEEVKVEPTEKCVDGHFSKFKELGESEQEAYYKAFDTCVDRSFVNTDNLDVVHWFNFYEDPQQVAEDFLEFDMNIEGALSAVGYTSFPQQVNLIKKGFIGLVLDGKISLAFKRDAETERDGRFPTKMPGKLEGSKLPNPEDWIQYMVLDKDSYELSPSERITNEFIMVNPKVKAIVMPEDYIKSMINDTQVSQEGKTTADLIKNIFKKLNKINMPIYNFEGTQINDMMDSFSDSDIDTSQIIKKTLLGEKELKFVGSYDSTYNLFKNFAIYPSVPVEDNFAGSSIEQYVKKITQLGNYDLIVGKKITEKQELSFAGMKPSVKCFDPEDKKIKKFTAYQISKRFFQTFPIYFKYLSSVDNLKLAISQISMTETASNVFKEYSFLLSDDILGYFTILSPNDFGVPNSIPPTISNSYLPYAAAEIIKNLDINKIVMPQWNYIGKESDDHLFIIDKSGRNYSLKNSFKNKEELDQTSYMIFKSLLMNISQ